MSVFDDTDIAFISETWLTSQHNKTTASIQEYDFKIEHVFRNDPDREKGGCVAIILKKSINHKLIKTKPYSSFQHIIIQLLPKSNEQKLILVSIYRLLYVSTLTFLQEFTQLLENLP